MSRYKFDMETADQDKLERVFRDMAWDDKKKIINAAFRKAVKPTVERAYANAPVGRTGNLRRSIGTVSPYNEIAIVVGTLRTRGKQGYHGHLVEEGTVDRFYITKRGNKHFTGKMNPNGYYAHFLKKAVDATENQTLNILSQEWYKVIDRYHRKNGL
jgi:hypothetical protein